MYRYTHFKHPPFSRWVGEPYAEEHYAAHGSPPSPPCLAASLPDLLTADVLEEHAHHAGLLRVLRIATSAPAEQAYNSSIMSVLRVDVSAAAPGAARREGVMRASALRAFAAQQEWLLQVGSHFIEVTRKRVKGDPAVMGAIDQPRVLEHLYELSSRFEAAKVALMREYMNIYDEATDPTERARLREAVCVNPTQVYVNPTQVCVDPTQVC